MFSEDSHKDSCGTGILFSKNNTSSHSILKRSISSLQCMRHRGALSYDGKTPDGVGIMIDLDHNFFQKKLLDEQNLILPARFGLGMFFVNKKFPFFKKESCHD